MKKTIFTIFTALLITGCSSSPMEQKEYKARLDYCEKIEMTVNIEKNEKNRPIDVECIDEHGSTFESKIN
jgi:predicted component of type VI protein secretion system